MSLSNVLYSRHESSQHIENQTSFTMAELLPLHINSENLTPVFLPRETLDHPCDLTLVVEDGEEFKAHRQVLSEASPFFEKLLNSDMKESKEGVVRFKMFTKSVMAATLEYIYTGIIVQISTQEIAQGLIVAAGYFLLPNLKTLAEIVAVDLPLNTSNCISTYHFAELYQCEELLSKARQVILANFTAIAKTEEFLNLSSKEVEMLISSDEMYVSAEEDVFKIILTWIDCDKNERKKHFDELFRHVRLIYVSRDYICSDIVTNDFVKSSKACLDLVMDTVQLSNSENRENVCAALRSSYQTTVIVACVQTYILCYFPRQDKWCKLADNSVSNLKDHEVFTCHGKLYFLQFLYPWYRSKLQCYDPFSDSWTLLPYKEDRYLRQIFVGNKDEVYALVSDRCLECDSLSCLCCRGIRGQPYARKKQVSFITKYEPASNVWEEISSFDFGAREGICIVIKDNLIYFIGGGVREEYMHKNVANVDRYDLCRKQWDKVADIQEARMFACGAATKEKLFIAGGLDLGGMRTFNTCEVYNKTTNEWQFIANLIARPSLVCSMVCCDDNIYVLGGCYERNSHQTVECYDPDKNEWNEKTKLPIRIPIEPRSVYLHASTMRIFTRSLSNLPVTWLSPSSRPCDKRKCVIM